MSATEQIMTRGTCGKCGEPFDYLKKGRRRIYCPKCIELNLRESWKQFREGRQSGNLEIYARKRRPAGKGLCRPFRKTCGEAYRDPMDDVAKMTCDEIALREGMGARAVAKTLQKALCLIRTQPELKRLVALWKADGAPVPGSKADVGEQLLEWQMELANWYELYEKLRTPETQAEAEECLAEIARFNQLLTDLIQKLK